MPMTTTKKSHVERCSDISEKLARVVR